MKYVNAVIVGEVVIIQDQKLIGLAVMKKSWNYLTVQNIQNIDKHDLIIFDHISLTIKGRL